MHYFDDPQARESKLTRDFTQPHLWRFIAEPLGIGDPYFMVVEMPKRLYGAEGDVDIGLWLNPRKHSEYTLGIEVKTLFLDHEGKLKAQKIDGRHHIQLTNLANDGWDYVWLLDFIVTTPSHSWFHPHAFAGFDQFARSADAGFGHIVFQVSSVVGRPESEAGGCSYQVLSTATRQVNVGRKDKLLAALRRLDFSRGGRIDRWI